MKRISYIIIFNIIMMSPLAAEKTNVAVLDLEADGINKSEAKTLTEKLRGELIKTGAFEVIERNRMDAILNEQGFQQTGCTSDECAVQIGQLIGVREIIAGSIGKIENTYVISLRIIDVGKGKIKRNITEEVPGTLTDVLKAGVPNAARKIAGFTDGFISIEPREPAVPAGGTTVSFVNLYVVDHLYLDGDTKLLVDGEKNQRVKKALTRISPGRHVMHYDAAFCSRYYSEFEVKEGENFIEPKFREYRLPNISRHITYNEVGKENTTTAEKRKEYYIFVNNQKTKFSSYIKFNVDISPKSGDEDKLTFNYQWKVVINGKVAGNDKATEVRSQSGKETYRKEIIVYKDKYHYYSFKYYIIRRSTGIDLQSGYIEYLKK